MEEIQAVKSCRIIEFLEWEGHLFQLPCNEQGPFLPGHLLLILQLPVMPAGSSTSPCADKHHSHLVWTFPIGAAHSSIWKATKRTHTLNTASGYGSVDQECGTE